MTILSSNTDLGSYEELKHKAVVRVPNSKVLSFPNLCVKCGKQEPDTNYTVKHHSYYSKVAMFGWYSEKENFPAHKNCVTALKGRQIALCFVFLFLTGCVIYFIPAGYPKKTPLLFMVPFILGYVIWQEISPPTVSLSTAKGMKIFEFKSKEYGKKFATINDIPNKNIFIGRIR